MVATAQKPTRQYELFNDKIEVLLFGQPYNWRGASQLKNGKNSLAREIAQAAAGAGARIVWLPYAGSFNGRVCHQTEFTRRFFVNTGGLRGNVMMQTGATADGLFIPIGHAFAMTSGDCPTIVATDIKSGKTIAAHAGRDCLIDRERVKNGAPGRHHPSVVDAIVDRFTRQEIDRLRIFVCAGIGAIHFNHRWAHPLWGEFNKRLINYVSEMFGEHCVVSDPTEGCLDLQAIIKAQFAVYDIAGDNITSDGTDTYGDGWAKKARRWWSHHRFVENGKRGEDGRNGILVVRHL